MTSACDARGHGFYVGIAERGVMQWPFLSTSNEDVACRRFLERAGELYQCLVSVRERTDIEALQAALESAGITVWRNDIPQLRRPSSLPDLRARPATCESPVGSSPTPASTCERCVTLGFTCFPSAPCRFDRMSSDRVAQEGRP